MIVITMSVSSDVDTSIIRRVLTLGSDVVAQLVHCVKLSVASSFVSHALHASFVLPHRSSTKHVHPAQLHWSFSHFLPRISFHLFSFFSVLPNFFKKKKARARKEELFEKTRHEKKRRKIWKTCALLTLSLSINPKKKNLTCELISWTATI